MTPAPTTAPAPSIDSDLEAQSWPKIGKRGVVADITLPKFTLDEVLAFLHGEAQLDGVWFGERHPTERGVWWRKHLRAAVLADRGKRPMLTDDVHEQFIAMRAELNGWRTTFGSYPDKHYVWNGEGFERKDWPKEST